MSNLVKPTDLEEKIEEVSKIIDGGNCDLLDNYSSSDLFFVACELRNRKEFDKQVVCLEKCVEKGLLEAMLILGALYSSKMGSIYTSTIVTVHEEEVETDYSKSRFYYELAAKKGSGYALYRLGNFYQFGLGVEQDYNKAKKYYVQAMEKGEDDATLALAHGYMVGDIVKKDSRKLVKYMIKLIKNKNINGLLALSDVYDKKLFNKSDLNKILKYLKKMENENLPAMILMIIGDLYYELGNFKHAKEIYEKMGQECCETAFIRLGVLYLCGLGVEKDYSKAKEYFEKSIEKPDKSTADGLKYLGKMYLYGVGVAVDVEKAIKYLEEAVALGDKEAKNIILLYKYRNNETIDYRVLFDKETDIEFLDEYASKIIERIRSGEKIVRFISLNEVTFEKLESLSENTIVNINTSDEIYNEFYNVSDAKKILSIAKKILEDIDLSQNEEDIFMQIYIKLGFLIDYDYDAIGCFLEETTSTSRNLMTLVNKKGVCVGYSVVLKALLDMVGIESKVVSSTSSGRHAFNQVKINNQWYYCDLTWDVSTMRVTGQIPYALVSEKDFKEGIPKDNYCHEPSFSIKVEKADKTYENRELLFMKNYIKLFKEEQKKFEELVKHDEDCDLRGYIM